MNEHVSLPAPSCDHEQDIISIQKVSNGLQLEVVCVGGHDLLQDPPADNAAFIECKDDLVGHT